MKKILFILLVYSCSAGTTDNRNETKIRRIDSILVCMDSAGFNAGVPVKRGGIVYEPYESHTVYYRKDFPQFLKYHVHNNDSLLNVDSTFYYENESLIKFACIKTNTEKYLDSISCYFENEILIGGRNELDQAAAALLQVAAKNYLRKAKKQIKLLQ
jgi:hypothetical protein